MVEQVYPSYKTKDFLREEINSLKWHLRDYLKTGNPSDMDYYISELIKKSDYTLARDSLSKVGSKIDEIITKYDIPLEELVKIYHLLDSPDRYKLSKEDLGELGHVQSLAFLRELDRLVITIPSIKQMREAQSQGTSPAWKIQASRDVLTTLDPETQKAVRSILSGPRDFLIGAELRDLPYRSPLFKSLDPQTMSSVKSQGVTGQVLELFGNALQGVQRFISGGERSQ